MQNRKDGRRRSKKKPPDKINAESNHARGKRASNEGGSASSGQETARAKSQELRDQARFNARTEIELRERMESARAQFVSMEVDLALTFCEMASSSRDSASAQRRIDRAMEAQASAEHYLQELDVSPSAKSGIGKRLKSLKESLDKLSRPK